VTKTPSYPEVDFINVLAPDVSKGQALEALASHLEISLTEVIAIGNGTNDISLLEKAGMAVAMGNSPDELKAVADYVTLDIDPNTRPTVVGDAHNMPFPDSSFDAVTHIYVFEHLCNPSKAAGEILRVLKPGGYMLGIVPFFHPYHARKDGYRDYWRFSKDGIEIIFSGFKNIEIFKIGRYFRAAIGFLPFLWRFKKPLEFFAYILDRIFIKDSRNTTAGYIIFARR